MSHMGSSGGSLNLPQGCCTARVAGRVHCCRVQKPILVREFKEMDALR